MQNNRSCEIVKEEYIQIIIMLLRLVVIFLVLVLKKSDKRKTIQYIQSQVFGLSHSISCTHLLGVVKTLNVTVEKAKFN